MPDYEARLTALEQEHAELKRENDDLKEKIELHAIALGGLVNKAMLEHITDQNVTLFRTLSTHDEFTNMQLAELREKIEVQIEGKLVGMQTEVRRLQTDVSSLKTTMNQHTATLDQHTSLLTQILARLPEKP